ncbi:GNAT family N-acetyltransferase [Streptomyces stelliscabiei]|uniref:GNAT family N-acetyltransferase n=1 Tax=Streptomyces stelliscabiei TaxID=146820 RepID=UPI002FF2C59F
MGRRDVRTANRPPAPARLAGVRPGALGGPERRSRGARALPGVLTREQSDASAARFQSDLDGRRWGWWAVEVRATGEFVGFAGLDPVDEDMPFSGVEAGWRLAAGGWRLAAGGWRLAAGAYALGARVTPPRPGGPSWTSASHACVLRLRLRLRLPEILAVTTAGNLRSQAVTRRLGMSRDRPTTSRTRACRRGRCDGAWCSGRRPASRRTRGGSGAVAAAGPVARSSQPAAHAA